MIQLVHLNTVIIRLYRLCGCLLSVGLSNHFYHAQAILWTRTLVSCAWFPGGWCGPDGCADRQQRASSWRQGLLPSTSPYDIIDDGPTWVNFNRRDIRGNTTGLSYGLLRFLMKFHVWQCSYLVQAAGLSFLSRRVKLFRREHPLDLTG